MSFIIGNKLMFLLIIFVFLNEAWNLVHVYGKFTEISSMRIIKARFEYSGRIRGWMGQGWHLTSTTLYIFLNNHLWSDKQTNSMV
jgi:hypothetical protein